MLPGNDYPGIMVTAYITDYTVGCFQDFKMDCLKMNTI